MSNRIRRGTVMPEPRRIAIEQAVALGWTPDFIVRQLGVSMNDVERVEEYLDALQAERLDANGHVMRDSFDLAATDAADRNIHGTLQAFTRHKRARETPCHDCQEARRASQRDEHALQPHGTLAAARRHYRNGEKPCYSCRQAMARRDASQRGYGAA